MAHQIDKSALIMHSAERMFALVDDIGRYPEFLPWCAGAEVHERTDSKVLASLEVAKGGVRHRLTTHNSLVSSERIDMTLVDGPFRNLTGHWLFKPLDSNACKVVLQLDFEFSGALSRMTFGPIFNQAANTMVEAFCQRANELYAETMVAR